MESTAAEETICTWLCLDVYKRQVLDGLNAEAIKPNASVWYVITSRSFVPLRCV